MGKNTVGCRALRALLPLLVLVLVLALARADA